MATVNSEIKRILREKDAGIKTGVASMQALLKELQKQVLSEIGSASLTTWDTFHLQQQLEAINRHMVSFEAQAIKEAGSLLDESWAGGVELVDSPLRVAGEIWTGFGMSTSSLDVIKDFTFHKISGLSDAAWDKVRSELTLGILGGKTPQEVATAIGKNLKDPGIFRSVNLRAEAITRTEMGRTFSMASQQRMEQAAEHVEGLEKQWLHRGHPKIPRPSHLGSHGQHVPVKSPFLIGGVPIMHPRDPGAGIEENIHCGCDSVPWKEEWKQAA